MRFTVSPGFWTTTLTRMPWGAGRDSLGNGLTESMPVTWVTPKVAGMNPLVAEAAVVAMERVS